jgi:hypothetical protein
MLGLTDAPAAIGRLTDTVRAGCRDLLRAGRVDEIRVHLVPVLPGVGAGLFEDVGGHIRLEATGVIETAAATHVRYRVVG